MRTVYVLLTNIWLIDYTGGMCYSVNTQ